MENLDFLLSASEPWVSYRTMRDLLGLSETDPAVLEARAKMLAHPLVQRLIEDLSGWPGVVISSHKSAGQLFHKLAFAADLGFTKEDGVIGEVLQKIMAHQSAEGPFQLPINNKWGWALCDAPLLVYSLAKMGYTDHPDVRRALDHLLSHVRENGWPCFVSKELGSFRGPGKKGDPCPFVNLIMLKTIALFESQRNSDEARIGVECLLHLWEDSLNQHPYMFYMGTDFRKLKAPFIWYDILHVAEVLSHYEFAAKDPRFAEMLAVIHAKADENGLYTPESEWTAFRGWDFAQKKSPSPWLTFLIYRIDRRAIGS